MDEIVYQAITPAPTSNTTIAIVSGLIARNPILSAASVITVFGQTETEYGQLLAILC